MLVAVDIGNTNTVVGAFRDEHLIATWRVTTEARRTADEYGALFETLFLRGGLSTRDIHGVVIGSVVPGVQVTLEEVSTRYWGCPPLSLSPRLDFGLDVIYDPPTAVGADRIANAVAAIDRYGVPAIVVDFGTATTFDAISREAAYVGGAIAPGLEISQEALFARTARLPRVPLQDPGRAVGASTVTSLQSGILYGYAGLVDGLVERFRAELGHDARVIATGGLARVVSPHASSIRFVDVDLTLNGLRLLYHRNRVAASAVPGVRET
jgi:type III pantothenate kinase